MKKHQSAVVFQKNTIEKEGEMFFAFLNHPKFPTHRKFIFRAFQELESKLENCEDKKEEEKRVKEFISKFYEGNGEVIAAIEEKSERKIIEESNKALEVLSDAMEYSWGKGVTYIATPTVLPFSPFGDNIFYFSILGEIFKRGETKVIEIMIHEISHFIFFEMLASIQREENLEISEALIHYTKEALTAALFRSDPMVEFFGTEEYTGNPEIRELYVKPGSEKKVSLIDYIAMRYIQAKKKENYFYSFLKSLILTMSNIEKEIEEKGKLWKKYGKSIFSEEGLLSEYKKEMLVE
jgi:hypothetical protein